MTKYIVSGYYKATKYVDRIVEADNMTDARHKAWSDDYEDEIERDEESISNFESTDVEEIE